MAATSIAAASLKWHDTSDVAAKPPSASVVMRSFAHATGPAGTVLPVEVPPERQDLLVVMCLLSPVHAERAQSAKCAATSGTEVVPPRCR